MLVASAREGGAPHYEMCASAREGGAPRCELGASAREGGAPRNETRASARVDCKNSFTFLVICTVCADML